ncbi:MAG: glycerol-3-phosphate dehydrogenase (NAD(P)+) [Verrucomicrobiales bacterium]|jgi:glycerol-3-phosphate dehydrogenase (NAD(P)+)
MSASQTKVGVIGSGSWGTALALIAAAKNVPVTLWGRNAENAAALAISRINGNYLPGTVLPENITPTSNLRDLTECGLLIFAVPSKVVRDVAGQVGKQPLKKDAILLSCIKGIENSTGMRASEILADVIPSHPVAVLSGPNHAEEIAEQLPAAAVIGAQQQDTALFLQSFFTLPWFRTYTSTDVIGIEWGAAVKNVFALASGITSGLGLGDNARAALITRGLAEMIRLGSAFGGKRETFQGLSGVGDLIATCFSEHSRNYRVGKMLGKGLSLETIQNSMHMVAEGVPNTQSIHDCARKTNVRTPLIDMVYAILYGGMQPADAISELLSRDPRPEADQDD